MCALSQAVHLPLLSRLRFGDCPVAPPHDAHAPLGRKRGPTFPGSPSATCMQGRPQVWRRQAPPVTVMKAVNTHVPGLDLGLGLT